MVVVVVVLVCLLIYLGNGGLFFVVFNVGFFGLVVMGLGLGVGVGVGVGMVCFVFFVGGMVVFMCGYLV